MEEKILVKSTFNAAACHKFATIFYIIFFIYGWLMGFGVADLNIGIAFLVGASLAIIMGGLIHIAVYCSFKNNQVVLTNYNITGTYKRSLSLNIPIDAVTSVSKGTMGSLCITCAGNRYNISYVGNRDAFCAKLNELLSQRTQQALHGSSPIVHQQSNYDEIQKLKQLLDSGIITQEEFDAKKKQILGL